MSQKHPLQLLDGPMGTELAARGVPTPLPGWSVGAIRSHPSELCAIHADYAAAGATVHTACTFRTRPETAGSEWAALAREAVALCRSAVPRAHRVAGSVAPIADCYRPDLSPPDSYEAHRALANTLAEAGCDLLLCETFPHHGEALAAVRAARSTGLETWLALTAGPSADLMSPASLAETAARAWDVGVAAVLVNCVATSATGPFVARLAQRLPHAVIGAYANAGHPDEGIGWVPGPPGPARYLRAASEWRALGASILGGCCGTGPQHIRAIAKVLT